MVTADCLPVVMYDSVKKILALVHLGWKGVDGKLAIKVIKRLSDLGSKPVDIHVWIGPGVRKETYKFESNLVKQKTDPKWIPYLKEIGKYTHIDLLGHVLGQLNESEICIANVSWSDVDTTIDKNYYSHYRSVRTGESEGRFATVVMMK